MTSSIVALSRGCTRLRWTGSHAPATSAAGSLDETESRPIARPDRPLHPTGLPPTTSKPPDDPEIIRIRSTVPVAAPASKAGGTRPESIRTKNLGIICPDGGAEVLRLFAVTLCPAGKPGRTIRWIGAPAREDRGVDRFINRVGDVVFRFHRRRADFPVIAPIQLCDPSRGPPSISIMKTIGSRNVSSDLGRITM